MAVRILPETSPDIELYKDLILDDNGRLKASYGGVPFGVVSYSIRTGRQQETKDLSIQTSKKMDGDSDDDDGTGRNRKELAASATTIVDGTTGLIIPGVIPQVIDEGPIPTRITLIAFFITTPAHRIVPDSYNSSDIAQIGRYVSYTVYRDAFLKLTASGTPAMLQLPTYGKFLVRPGKINTKYSHDKGGIEYIECEFFRATEDLTVPSNTGAKIIVTNNATALINTISANISNLQDKLVTSLQNTTGGLSSVKSTDMCDTNTSLLDTLSDGIGSLTSTVISTVEDGISTVDSYIRQVTALSNNITSLILAPVQLAEDILSSYTELSGSITRPIESYEYMKDKMGIFIDEMQDITYATLDTLGIYNSSVKIQHISSSFTVMAEAATESPFDSSDSVIEARQEITDLYTSAIEIVSGFPEYEDLLNGMQALYTSLMSYMLDQQTNLPNTRTVETPKNCPLVVTSYAVYGDSDRVDTLAARNEINNQLLPPTELKVLTE